MIKTEPYIPTAGNEQNNARISVEASLASPGFWRLVIIGRSVSEKLY